MDGKLQGSILVLASAVCYGLQPIFAQFAYNDGAQVTALLFVRFSLAFLILGAILGLRGKLSLPDRRTLIVLAGLGGIGYFLQSTFYFNALLYVPISVVVLVLYTYPAFVTGLSFALGFERMSRRVILALALALTGLVLVAGPILNLSPIGVLLSLGAALVYTTYILVSSRWLKRTSGEVSTFYVTGTAALSFAIFGTITGGLGITWSQGAWLWVLLIIVVSTVMALSLFFAGLKRIGPSRSSILSTAELVTSVTAAFVVFGEALSPEQVAGGVLIVAAAFLTALRGKHHEEHLSQ